MHLCHYLLNGFLSHWPRSSTGAGQDLVLLTLEAPGPCAVHVRSGYLLKEWMRMGIFLSSSVAQAALIKYHGLGGLKDRSVLSPSSGD